MDWIDGAASTNDLATAFAELSSTFVARMYWLIFWMVTVLIVVNVMFAFVLQVDRQLVARDSMFENTNCPEALPPPK